jgi:hypothetical protein
MWTKLLLLLLAAAVVWYAFKIFNRPKSKAAASPAIERTIKCGHCGVYVPTVNAAPCGRDGCPHLPPARAGAP